jgi:glyoxylase-like metal-dependent hydrolase (beta-lactamase superfamily II)
MVQVRQLPLGPLQTNCYLVGCENTSQAAVIDPSWNGRSIVAMAENDGWDITHILLTHSHFDHVGGLGEIKEETQAPIYIHPEAIDTLRNAAMSAGFFGVRIPSPPGPDELLIDNQIIEVGELKLEVLYTPGHAPGHVCFYISEYNLVFDGDVLFQGSIGRSDLPGGDFKRLMKSINERLITLPDETKVFPGHGPSTTIANERSTNPFLQE